MSRLLVGWLALSACGPDEPSDVPGLDALDAEIELYCDLLAVSELDIPGSATVHEVGPSSANATIQQAIDAASSGDWVYVHNGVYPEAIATADPTRGMGPKTVHIVGQNRHNVIIDGGAVVADSGEVRGVLLTSGSTLKNLTVVAAGTGVYVRDHAEIFRVRSTDNRVGVSLTGKDLVGDGGDASVVCSTIDHSSDIGVEVRGGLSPQSTPRAVRVDHSYLTHNTDAGLQARQGLVEVTYDIVADGLYGIWYAADAGYLSGELIAEHNVSTDNDFGISNSGLDRVRIADNEVSANRVGIQQGEMSPTTTQTAEVVGNRVFDSTDHGITFDHVARGRAASNLVIGSGDSAVRLFQSLDVAVDHNTLVGSSVGIDVETQGADGPDASYELLGNVIVEMTDAAIVRECNQQPVACGESWQAGHNLFWDNGDLSATHPSSLQSGDRNADPLFTDRAGLDFSLASGSPAQDSGVLYTPMDTRDVDGNARVQGVHIDRGAFERASSDPLCASGTGTLSVDNLGPGSGTLLVYYADVNWDGRWAESISVPGASVVDVEVTVGDYVVKESASDPDLLVSVGCDQVAPVQIGEVEYLLHVGVDGSGGGTVGSSPPGIDCGTACDASFVDGTPVTLTATPDAESFFVGWSEDCPNPSGDQCQLVMDEERTVTAWFSGDVP